MSIILKEIDLPPNAKVQIIVESPAESFRKQIPKSKVIQIPKGHGRLIDGDELKANYTEDDDVYTPWLRADIDDAPTILEAEE